MPVCEKQLQRIQESCSEEDTKPCSLEQKRRRNAWDTTHRETHADRDRNKWDGSPKVSGASQYPILTPPILRLERKSYIHFQTRECAFMFSLGSQDLSSGL